MTLFCSLPSLPSLPIPLPSIFLSSVLPSPPPAIPPLAPAKNYPSWIAALPSHMADDLLTLYASLLTFHFPPYQGFRIHAHNPPGLPHGFAVHHPLCAGPLLILSYMPVEEFDLARCREAHISGLLATAADMVSPCLYLLSVFGTRWRAIRVSEVEESVECSPVIHPDALPPTTFPGDCSAHTWAPSLLSTESFRTFSEIAHDMKAFFLPHWIAPEEGEIVVRLPTYRIGELTPTSAAAGDRNAIHWLAAPEMIEILPSADQNPLPLPNNARRARVRLPRSTN
ncbi:hypothetical protein CALCODRAFT_48401 [Calocera cornea HHB12733]|uniref:Uncharacterized protein n=1 Tax=Calocera cornea HHB12733 TaxID=1353952 RepID=A0A165DU83_9BASI|nr:hypothetical protein CALCODRAFT_48401 [Calocera cornea HHB12733]